MFEAWEWSFKVWNYLFEEEYNPLIATTVLIVALVVTFGSIDQIKAMGIILIWSMAALFWGGYFLKKYLYWRANKNKPL